MKKTFKVILIVLLVIILAAIGAIWYVMNRLTENAVPIVEVTDEIEETQEAAMVPEDTVIELAEESAAPEAIEATPEPEAAEDTISEEELLSMTVEQDQKSEANDNLGIKQADQIHEDVINILLVGVDVRRINPTAHANADTIMMASFNKQTKVVTLVSFMRDSYMQIRSLKGNAAMNKLNSAYANGGMGWVINTLNYKKNYGLDIQNYMGVGFKNFQELIDAVGGLDLELTAEECYYINWRCAELTKSDPKDDRFEILTGNDLAVLEEVDGMHHLNGLQTMWYARDRTTGDEEAASGSDFTRTSRQQEVLGLVYDKVRSGLTLKEMAGLATFIMEHTYTNLKFSKLCELGLFLLKNDITIETLNVPTDGSWSYDTVTRSDGSQAEVITFNIDANRKRLHEALYGDLLNEATPEPEVVG